MQNSIWKYKPVGKYKIQHNIKYNMMMAVAQSEASREKVFYLVPW